MDVETALALEIHLEEVGPRRREDPDDAAAVARVRHLLRQHRVDAPGQAAVAVAALTFAGSLIGFVDKDDDLSQRAQDGKDLFQVGFRRAHPAVAKILEYHARDAELARPALHEERLSGADAAADQVAHRQRAQRALAQELRVLAQPRLDGSHAGHVVHRERRFDEVEEALALALDQLFLDLAEPLRRDAFVVAERQGNCRPRANAAQSGETRGERVHRHVALGLQIRKLRSSRAPSGRRACPLRSGAADAAPRRAGSRRRER